jgi:small subunit ribosomal protein S16
MATKIRLQRHGRKGYAFYQVVVADSRAPRDGKFIERIGSYNPNTNPATIDLNFERALYWLQTGAQPTDTARMILSREGVCLKKHLLEGVKKGAFNEDAAEMKFQAWLTEKKSSLLNVTNKDRDAQKAAAKARLDAEKEVNKAKAEALAKKKAEAAAAAEPETPTEEETPTAETETPATAEAPTVEAETPAEVPTVAEAEETPAATETVEPTAEAETPAATETAEPAAEAPAAETEEQKESTSEAEA